MKKKLPYILLILVLIIAICLNYYFKNNTNDDFQPIKTSTKIITNLEEKISNNSIWCGTFPLVWNELKEKFNDNENIKFVDGNSDEVKNLNKGYFNKNYLDINSYYVKSGVVSNKLKIEIEEAIKEKFNEKSDILDGLDWTEDKDRYLIYSMLFKDAEFENKFEKLTNRDFNEVKNVKYFGIKKQQAKLKDQVKVLYYIDEKNYAVELQTKGKDKIILEMGSNKDTFKDIFNDVMTKAKTYTKNSFTEDDVLAIPYIETNLKQKFGQFVGKKFVNKSGEEYTISEAIQTIRFRINESGAKLKSEAAINIYKSSATPDARYLVFNKDFTLFMVEKEVPYLAISVNDIKEYQNIK